LESKVSTLERAQKQTAEKVDKESENSKVQQDAIGLGLVPGAGTQQPQTLMIGYIPQAPPMGVAPMGHQQPINRMPGNGW